MLKVGNLQTLKLKSAMGWKYHIFLTKGGDIVWVTASTKLRDLLIMQSRDKCKVLYLHFRNTYGYQN